MRLTSPNEITVEEVYKATIDYCSRLDHSQFILESSFVRNTNKIYFAYPLLFKGLYTPVAFSDSFLEQLSVAGFLFYRSLIISDRLKDNDEIEKVRKYDEVFLKGVSDFCRKEATIILESLFNEHSLFWKFVAEAENQFYTEKQLEKKIELCSSKQEALVNLRELAFVKSVYGRLALDALYVKALESSMKNDESTLCGQHRIGLEQYKTIAFALQVIDDLDDIAADFVNNQTNIAIELVRRRVKALTISEIKWNFYFSGLAESLLAIVQKEIEDAFGQRSSQKDVLSRFLQQVYTVIAARKYTIESYNRTRAYSQTFMGNIYDDKIYGVTRSLVSLFQSAIQDKCILSGVIGLVEGADEHFKESYHFMYLPPNQGFIDDGMYVGNLFQLSTLLLFFQKLEVYSRVDMSNLTKPICEYILSKRQSNYYGTWCYLNGYKYLAPDFDDMSQIIRGLGNALAKKHCILALTMAAERIVQEGTAITTWIPAMTVTEESQYQVYLNETKWKDTVDIEVVANLLLLFDSISYDMDEKFRRASEILLEYVLAKYNEAGGMLLSPRWYYSSLYPIFLLSKLKNVSLPCNFVRKLVPKIISKQNANGGWGGDFSQDASDSLNTALAVISLQNFSRLVDLNELEGITKLGVKYIRGMQGGNGLWEKVHFIKPRFEEPYSSQLITTAFCLEALFDNENRNQSTI